jgi:hypothetical protein
LHGCKPAEERSCFKGSGDLIRERVALDEFHEIEIHDRINIVLIQDSIHYAVIETGRNLYKQIELSVSGGRLYIDDHNNCDFLRSFTYPVNVFVHFKKLDTFWYYGAGSVYSPDTLFADSLSLNCQEATGKVALKVAARKLYVNLHTGVSEYELSGRSDELYVYSRGTAPIHLENIPAPYVWANNISPQAFHVRPTGLLTALIQYKGNVVVYGNPQRIDEKNWEYGGKVERVGG